MHDVEIDGFWDILRLVNFVILFAAFVLLVYKATLRLALEPHNFHMDRLVNLAWTTLALYSIGEVLYSDVTGGPRIVFAFLVAAFQLYAVIFWYKPRRGHEEQE